MIAVGFNFTEGVCRFQIKDQVIWIGLPVLPGQTHQSKARLVDTEC